MITKPEAGPGLPRLARPALCPRPADQCRAPPNVDSTTSRGPAGRDPADRSPAAPASGERTTMATHVRDAPAEQVVELPEPWRSAAVTVVLPTYNEAANLPVVVAELLGLRL